MACIQFESADNLKKNVSKATGLIGKAADAEAELICLPEYFYSNQALDVIIRNSEQISGLVHVEIEKIVKKKKITVLYNTPKREAGRVMNTSVVSSPEGMLGEYSKINLFPNKPFNEKDYFAAGKEVQVIESGLGKLGIAICYDLRFPEIFRKMAFKGAEIILIPSAFPMQKVHHWRTLLTARAIENQLFVAAINKAGKDPKTEYAGNSMVISPKGRIIAESAGNKEEIIYSEIDLSEVGKTRNEINYLKQANPN